MQNSDVTLCFSDGFNWNYYENWERKREQKKGEKERRVGGERVEKMIVSTQEEKSSIER